ncbi:MAG: hypothetical protein ABIP39_01050 [Polyangiaceae bacterium]
MQTRNVTLGVALSALALLAGCAASGRHDAAQTLATPACSGPPPQLLSQAGLYRDTVKKVFASDAVAYETRYPEWSNGATKRRFVQLPAQTKIDTSDMDHWSFSVGSRFWTEFTVAGKRVETRMIERTGPDARDFRFASYAWNEDETDAELTVLGAKNVRGTEYDIPSVGACWGCHAKEKERVLGFSAIQLSHDGAGPTVRSLSASGTLTTPVPETLEMPAKDVAGDALGYLHGNCGHCHGDQGPKGVRLRIRVGSREVDEDDRYQSVAGARALRSHMTGERRCSATAALDLQKPDSYGIRAVDAWIDLLGRDR